MFDLEQSIAEWRKQMLAAGIKTPAPLEELEIHLREEIERQMQSGLSAQPAFGIAVEKIGQAPELKREFKKTGAPMEMQEIIRLAGVICVAVALFLPGVHLFSYCFRFAFRSWIESKFDDAIAPLRRVGHNRCDNRFKLEI
jgi:hypothetical protein